MADQKSPPAISAISVKGFKAFYEEQRVEIRPLTLLAGANGSGKSSAIQPVLLLKQTLEAPFDPGPLRLDGPNVRFTSAEQFFWTQAKEFTVSIEDSLGHSVRNLFARSGSLSVDLETTEVKITRLGPASSFKAGATMADGAQVIRDRCFLDVAVLGL